MNNTDLRSLDALQFIQSYKLNDVDPTRFMIGSGNGSSGGHIYDSTNRGDTLTREPDNVGVSYSVYGYDYGGRYRGVANPDIAYVGYYIGSSNTGGMLLRSTAGGTLTKITTYPGYVPRQIVMDPQNDRRVFATDYNGHIYGTFNMGASWVNLSGNLSSLTNVFNIRSMDVISPTGALADDILMIGGEKAVFAIHHPGLAGYSNTWSAFGTGLSNALVDSLKYDQKDDIVVIGALAAAGSGPSPTPPPTSPPM